MATTDLAALRCHQRSNRSHHCIRIALQTPLPNRSARASAPEESRVKPSFLSQRQQPPLPAFTPAPRRAKVWITPARLPGALPGGFCSSCSPRLRLPTASGDGQGTTAPTGLPSPARPGVPHCLPPPAGGDALPVLEVPAEPGRGQIQGRFLREWQSRVFSVRTPERGRGRSPGGRGERRCLSRCAGGGGFRRAAARRRRLPAAESAPFVWICFSALRFEKCHVAPADSPLSVGQSLLLSFPSFAVALEMQRKV